MMASHADSVSRSDVLDVISRQNGVLWAVPAIVHRKVYCGRNIIAPNSSFSAKNVDERGYVPVEWWIMSRTEAVNGVCKENEGITRLQVGGEQVLLSSLLALAEKNLMGEFIDRWPLTKVLDIGGPPITPSFSPEQEVPPIPCHVHAGMVCSGCCVPPGKLEAYFFPPLDVPPYNLKIEKVITRLGLKPSVTRGDVVRCMKEFGQTDSMYSLLSEYEIRPWESWTIHPKVIHAPGPWLTFEIQRPQDDFNLLAWQLGKRLSGDEVEKTKKEVQLRGLKDEEALLEQTVDWEKNVDGKFKEKWWHQCQCLQEGDWGRSTRLFYDQFYGEGYEIKPGQRFSHPPTDKPVAGIVWSGAGQLNGQLLDSSEHLCREFLLCPGYELCLENTSPSVDLMVFTVYPMSE